MTRPALMAMTAAGLLGLLAVAWALWFRYGTAIALDGMIAFCF